MDFSLIPTLEFSALVKITSLLWNQADIRNTIFWFPLSSSDKSTKWREVENAVMEKVSHLALPKLLRTRVLGSVKPIGIQIFDWLVCHKNLHCGFSHLPKEICWTMQGLLDSRRTAEALIQDKTLHIITRYKLACTYCLQKDVSKLWPEFSVNLRTYLCNRKYSSGFLELDYVIRLWIREMEILSVKYRMEKFPRKCVLYIPFLRQETFLYQIAIEFSFRVCNKAAVEFFLQKLTYRKRKVTLVRCTEDVARNRPSTNVLERYSNVLCLLMSQMKEEQQLQVYERHPRTLECLLEWPWQVFFEEKAERVWEFLSAEDYNYLLNTIVLKIKKGFQDWNYSRLFRQFWRKSTNSHKRYVLDECIAGPLLTNLFKLNDMENISFLVQDATATEKEQIVYYRTNLILRLIRKDEWCLLKLLVSCLSSKDIVGKFQRRFQGLSSLEDKAEQNVVLRKFLKSLIKLIPVPRYAQDVRPCWRKEKVRLRAWDKLKLRRKPKQ